MSNENLKQLNINTTTRTADARRADVPLVRVWIGCLACYNSGRLVGEWYDAADASTVTPSALHIAARTSVRASCEELRVMDTDGLPVSREMSPQEATEWADVLDQVDEWQRDALHAWVRSGDYIACGQVDLPSLPDFEERYAGEWDSFRDYANEIFEECGYAAEIPEHLLGYFDLDAWARDLAYDYSTEPSSGGGVHVFRSL